MHATSPDVYRLAQKLPSPAFDLIRFIFSFFFKIYTFLRLHLNSLFFSKRKSNLRITLISAPNIILLKILNPSFFARSILCFTLKYLVKIFTFNYLVDNYIFRKVKLSVRRKRFFVFHPVARATVLCNALAARGCIYSDAADIGIP